MHTFNAMLLMLSLMIPAQDCGRDEYQAAIAMTEGLIEKKVDLAIPYVEIPHGEGEKECARVTFRIDNHGMAADVEVAESSGDIVLNLAAIRALKNYRFRAPPSKYGPIFMLTFEGTVGAALPPPVHEASHFN